MSDKRFAFLKDKAAQAEQPEHTSASGNDAGLAEQYGRRADPTYAQINANIPADLRRRFRAHLVMEERKMQEVLELLIEGYLDGRFKV